MLGVKIILLMFVITVIWVILLKVNYSDTGIIPEKDKKKFWYWGLGALALLDLFGLIYIVAYLLFFVWR